MDKTFCSSCQFELTEMIQGEANKTVCPNCGATSRTIGASREDSLKFYEGLGYKIKDAKLTGKAKIKLKGFSRYESSQKAKLVKRTMEVDQTKDLYKETVTDAETGELIHSCEEPLSQHKGHGSAKSKNTT